MKLQIDNFNNDDEIQTIHSLDIDSTNIYHQGKIPSGITAAFVIHLSPTENALVFFRCDLYCFVLFHNSKWNFDIVSF